MNSPEPADRTADGRTADSRCPSRLPTSLVQAGAVAVIGIATGVVASLGPQMRLGRRRGTPELEPMAPLPEPPAASAQALLPRLAGLYVGTTIAGDWLARVSAHGLSERGAARLLLTEDGVTIERAKRGRLFLPGRSIEAVRVEHAHAGKVFGEGGLLVITWELGGRVLDTGFRAQDAAQHQGWAQDLRYLLDDGPVVTVQPGRPPSAEPAAAGDEPAGEPAHRPDPLTAPLEALSGRSAHTQPGPLGAPSASPAVVGRARHHAVLVLEDGRVFRGEAYGAVGETVGEAVFNTGMTGYQETLTDPSYHRQVVVMTAPHIGNTGVNADDPESGQIWVAGYVVRDPARTASSWRSQGGLGVALRAAGVVGIAGVDTRALTRHLRERGAMRVGVSSAETDPQALLERVRASPGMTGADLAREVSTLHPYVVPAVGPARFRVAALDLGIKRSTPAGLAAAGCETYVLPATSTAADLLAVEPDGVFFSNGPGDPAAAGYAIEAMQGVLGKVPVFGICFGHQVLGRALGFDTYKLKYGHRGVNQPVRDRSTGRVAVTSHNHGFAVDADPGKPSATAYGRVEVSHIDLNDGVVEGLRCLDVPAFSVQYHPEAAPGPHDAAGLFPAFAELMRAGLPARGATR